MSTSSDLYSRAKRVIPGGVNSPVRAFNAVGGDPAYIARGYGARMVTADGAELVDFCGSWGPLILGHARQEVVEAICRAAAEGTSYGANTAREVEFAEFLCAAVPDLRMVRLVNSGTEAVMTAIRLARGFTDRRKIIKFEGCYHGHSDGLLVAAGSGLLTGGVTSSAGVPPSVVADVLIPSYNDLQAVQRIVETHGSDLAAIIVEPVAGNMGLVPPAPGFLEGLRAAADKCGALLILDEVISGFRFGFTTYGTLRGIRADLICLGKIIGGGMPVGALGGRADVMQRLAPLGPVYQAGTLSGNPVALAAGMATLQVLQKLQPYKELERLGAKAADGLEAAARQRGVPLRCPRMGGVFTPFFAAESVTNLATAKLCNTKAHAKFFHAMLDRGFYLPPSQFEVAFISAAHTEADIDSFLRAAGDALGG